MVGFILVCEYVVSYGVFGGIRVSIAWINVFISCYTYQLDMMLVIKALNQLKLACFKKED